MMITYHGQNQNIGQINVFNCFKFRIFEIHQLEFGVKPGTSLSGKHYCMILCWYESIPNTWLICREEMLKIYFWN